MAVNWERLYHEWDAVPSETKEKIERLLREKPKERLAELFEREPYAKRLYEKVVGKWVPPVKIPPPKVLPLIPEVCPIDGTPLDQVKRVPLLIKPIKLPAEEEYFRARLGLPIPTAKIEWIDVPPTMKVWMCEAEPPHYFERDAAGRLVQRTPEFLYRKILRERAKLERLVYPPPLVRRPPVVVAPPRPVKLQDVWWEFVKRVKGLSREEFMRLSDVEKGRIRAEFADWYAAGGVIT